HQKININIIFAMMMVQTMSSVNDHYMDSADRSYPSTSRNESGEGTPHPSKRKRYEYESMDTPCRPRSTTSARDSKINLEDDWIIEERSQINPVALPENVVELFRRPHVFPKDSYHELLKANGVSPKFYFKTSSNTAAFSKDSEITPDVIARRLQKKAKRSSIDEQLQSVERTVEDLPDFPAELMREKGKGSSIFVRSDGTYVVDVKGHHIEFAQVGVNLQQLRSSCENVSESSIFP
ncbi:unnamed protein product, partial [Allacma fusca]